MSPRYLQAALCGTLLFSSVLSCSSTETKSSSASSSGTPDTPPSTQPPVTTLFTKEIQAVKIEIDYAPGAEPFQGDVKKFGDPWSLLRTNALAIFDGKKTVSFPTTLAKMEKLDDVAAKNFSNADLVAVAAAHRTDLQYSNVVSFYVVFVDGYWLDEAGTERPDILGVSVGDTGIIGIFKKAIASPFVEQLTLIHQLGHAVGFVDNGVPVGAANRAHVDTANGHHCTNKQCAMSFANETVTGATAYASEFIRSPEAVLIGQECLSDARILENTHP
ncbi:MAG TPA: hypothetical protein VLT33_07365 [Labilithrix sp.]|nr:hypothetical protein [Labilithrix sp.]